MPLIAGRWWLIGAPCLIVFVSFVTRALFDARLYRIGSLVCLGFLVVTSINSFFVARNYVAGKWVWRGAEIVAPLVNDCPPGSVRVMGFTPGYAFTAHAPEDLFTSFDPFSAAWIDADYSTCPVLGWAEHVVVRGHARREDDFVLGASDVELLQLLKIRALPSEVKIYRHEKGFVILRRDAIVAQ